MIYLLEDDDSIRKLVLYGLDSQGFQAKGFALPSEFWRAMDAEMPELILLDIMLPEEDGLSILRKLRARPATKRLPIIMLTAKNSEYDRVIGLDHGADDFVSKPYNPALLLLHIEAVLRRNGGDENVIRYRDITLNLSRSSISGNGNEIELSKNECRILNYMFRNSGKIVSRDDIMNYLWDDCEFVDDNTLTVNITRVRHKLAELGYGDVISTKRGQGYYIEVSKGNVNQIKEEYGLSLIHI